MNEIVNFSWVDERDDRLDNGCGLFKVRRDTWDCTSRIIFTVAKSQALHLDRQGLCSNGLGQFGTNVFSSAEYDRCFLQGYVLC